MSDEMRVVIALFSALFLAILLFVYICVSVLQ